MPANFSYFHFGIEHWFYIFSLNKFWTGLDNCEILRQNIIFFFYKALSSGSPFTTVVIAFQKGRHTRGDLSLRQVGTSSRDHILVPATRFCVQNGQFTLWDLSPRLVAGTSPVVCVDLEGLAQTVGSVSRSVVPSVVPAVGHIHSSF